MENGTAEAKVRATIDLNEASREKYWLELTDSEKIERIRSIIKQNEYFKEKVYKLERKISKIINLVANHTHNERGIAVKPIDTYFQEDNELCGVGSSINRNEKEIYF